MDGASCKLPPVRTTQAVKAKTPRCLFIWQNNKLNCFSISSLFTLSDSCDPPPLWGDFVEVLRLLHRQTRSEPPWPQGCSPSWWTVYETRGFCCKVGVPPGQVHLLHRPQVCRSASQQVRQALGCLGTWERRIEKISYTHSLSPCCCPHGSPSIYISWCPVIWDISFFQTDPTLSNTWCLYSFALNLPHS